MWLVLFAVLGFAAAVLIVARDRNWGRAVGFGTLGVGVVALLATVSLSSGGGSVGPSATPSVSPTNTSITNPGDLVELEAPPSVSAGEEFSVTMTVRSQGQGFGSDLSATVQSVDPQVVSARLVAAGFDIVDSPPSSQQRPAAFTWLLKSTATGKRTISFQLFDDSDARASRFLGSIDAPITISVAATPAVTATPEPGDSLGEQVSSAATDVLGPGVSLVLTASVTAVTTAYVKGALDKREEAAKRKRAGGGTKKKPPPAAKG